MHALLLSRFVGAVPKFLDPLCLESRISTRIAYIDDASKPLGNLPFVEEERLQLQQLGYSLVPMTVGDGTVGDLASNLDTVDADTVLAERVKAGLPYIGSSAGAIIVGKTSK